MLFSKSKSLLGVDIGTSNIKIAQLRPKDNKFVLETYGIVNIAYQVASKDSDAAIENTAVVMKDLVRRSGVTTNRVIASLPNSAVFTSVIEIPKIPENELKSAVEFQAKKYVPLPLDEVALSWSLINDNRKRVTKNTNLGTMSSDNPNKFKILLTAVPTQVIDSYIRVFQKANLDPEALEIEALSLIRSLVDEHNNNVLLIDIGGRNTSLNIVENGYLRLSKNLNVGGETVTSSISQSLNVNFARAEQFKKDFGLTTQSPQIPQIMRPILDIIKNESMNLISIFESRGDRIDKILLSGAGSKLPSVAEYFGEVGKPVELANPWSHVIYDQQLQPIIQPLGLNLAVALGLAMRTPANP